VCRCSSFGHYICQFLPPNSIFIGDVNRLLVPLDADL
jgi:hypothetical protein